MSPDIADVLPTSAARWRAARVPANRHAFVHERQEYNIEQCMQVQERGGCTSPSHSSLQSDYRLLCRF